MRDIHISIVSHNQFNLVQKLLFDLEMQGYKDRIQVTITINISEDISTNFENISYPIHMIYNNHCKGFSENHNAAFNQTAVFKESNYFLVVNPDVQLHENVITLLINTLDTNINIGLVAPTVYGIDKTLEDNARKLPTPSRIIAKLFGKKGIWQVKECNQPDWVAGMFMAFRSSVFKKIGGFDENYFLYYEDVEICSRIWLEGYSLQVVENASIVHDAQRTSRRDFRYLRLHILSMLRFFSSDTYHKIKTFHQRRIKST